MHEVHSDLVSARTYQIFFQRCFKYHEFCFLSPSLSLRVSLSLSVSVSENLSLSLSPCYPSICACDNLSEIITCTIFQQLDNERYSCVSCAVPGEAAKVCKTTQEAIG